MECLEERIVLDAYSVVNLNDSGAGSLRQAILDANANAGADTINFSIAGTIKLTSGALPDITDTLNINGTTATGYLASPTLAINFNNFGGLHLTASAVGSQIQALDLQNASNSAITISGASSNAITGNIIGLALDGNHFASNKGSGIEIDGSAGNTIGGDTAHARNIISGNYGAGVTISGASATTDNQILGNYIGTDISGTQPRGNASGGIHVTGGASTTTIGASGAANVISGNTGNGILIDANAAKNAVANNIIGLAVNGTTALGNSADGIKVASSNGNLIGQLAVSGQITYYNTDNVVINNGGTTQPVTSWEGIRGADEPGQYMISGSSEDDGLLFIGGINGTGTSYLFNYPGALNTSIYGPDNLSNGLVRLVGTYKNPDYATAPVQVNGFAYGGTLTDGSQSTAWQTIDYPGAVYNFIHSTMGGLAVGNYDNPAAHNTLNLQYGPGHAEIYNVITHQYVTDVAYPGAVSNTVYGIWYNGGTSYTLAGGYSLDAVNNFADQDRPIGTAYIVDYDSATNQFSHWTSVQDPSGTNLATHFQGISSVQPGVYTLAAGSVLEGSNDPVQGSLVTIVRNADGSFGPAQWVTLNYAGPTPSGASSGTGMTSNNSVFGNQVVGVVAGSSSFPYQATVDSAFALSNIISANGANGIELDGANDNVAAMNFIGTDITGTLSRGNTLNGVLVTALSAGNVIGGKNTNGTLSLAPQENVISGNHGSGVLLSAGATGNSVSGNLIGLAASCNAALGNAVDGVRVDTANGNFIGQIDPVTGETYYNTDSIVINDGGTTQSVSGETGIRATDTTGQYYITGSSEDDGMLFVGTIDGTGTAYVMNYPTATLNTNVYGPDNLGNNLVRTVGTYKNSDYATAAVQVNGFAFGGTLSDVTNPSAWQTIDYPGAVYNYMHSTMGGLVVGNYDNPYDHGAYSLPYGPGHATIYNLQTHQFLTDVVFPGSMSNSVYGIWYNGGTSYTIVGGYSNSPVNNFANQDAPIGTAFMVDFDSSSGVFTNWASFTAPEGANFLSHFQGISSAVPGVYTLAADTLQSGSNGPTQGYWVTVTRNSDGSFGPATWTPLAYDGALPTGATSSDGLTSADSVYGNQVVGVVIGQSTFAYQATVNTSLQLSNVIGGNGFEGVDLISANDNRIGMNFIGTDFTGTQTIGNGQNGILVTALSAGNLIGGEDTSGNDPTNATFVRPAMGNLISGNHVNGVALTGQANHTQLSGNFIGTTASGDAALGNGADGVAIVDADNNSLIGCGFSNSPFVFYNVISGNNGNGLRVDNSSNTTIQANFFGMGADNQTAVANHRNGVEVEGNSSHTTMGGPIPLGNVDAANGENGIYLTDTASFFTSYNTFDGLAAFSTDRRFGNGQDGMLITSSGGNNLIRTNVVSNNLHDGIEITGNATDVRVVGNIVGMDTYGITPMGNAANGVEVGGNATNIVIGGPQPTFNVIPHNTISANGANGVAIVGNAHNITVNSGVIGTDLSGEHAFGNGQSGILVDQSAYGVTVGSVDPTLRLTVAANTGNGVSLLNTHDNTIVNTFIGTTAAALTGLGNGDSGIYLYNSFNNTIGSASGNANTIANNTLNGVYVASGTGNGIRENSIYGNGSIGIGLGAGANANQAAPVITSVSVQSPNVQLQGTLTSKPSTTFTVEFFANSTDAESGTTYLGSQLVTTNGSGVGSFDFSSALVPVGDSFFTATATDPNNNTSVFSVPAS
ncbi:MAG TPA: hypothetical protein VGG64_22420 [Pirellulales bacterium]